MLARLLLLFIVVPLCELILLLYMAHWTSPLTTLAIVVVTGIAGSLLARSQGFRVWGRINEELAGGRMPTDSLLDGLMILVAGALLLTPGLLTDAFGLSLLLPPCRVFYRRWLTNWFKSRVKFQMFSPGQADDAIDAGHEADHHGPQVFDVDAKPRSEQNDGS